MQCHGRINGYVYRNCPSVYEIKLEIDGIYITDDIRQIRANTVKRIKPVCRLNHYIYIGVVSERKLCDGLHWH